MCASVLTGAGAWVRVDARIESKFVPEAMRPHVTERGAKHHPTINFVVSLFNQPPSRHMLHTITAKIVTTTTTTISSK